MEDEARMAVAQNLKATHNVGESVRSRRYGGSDRQ